MNLSTLFVVRRTVLMHLNVSMHLTTPVFRYSRLRLLHVISVYYFRSLDLISIRQELGRRGRSRAYHANGNYAEGPSDGDKPIPRYGV